ncbi:unnamed protein product, partial [Brenthis ino]
MFARTLAPKESSRNTRVDGWAAGTLPAAACRCAAERRPRRIEAARCSHCRWKVLASVSRCGRKHPKYEKITTDSFDVR